MTRPTVAAQTGRAMAVVVALAVLVAALTTTGLVTSSARTEARRALAQQASLAAAVVNAADQNDVTPTLRVLRQQATPAAWRPARGPVRGDPLARRAYAALGSPRPMTAVSRKAEVDGGSVLVELRPLTSGGTFVMAKRTSPFGVAGGFLWRMLLGLLVGLLVAAAAAWLLARRIAHPLRAAAGAAHRLASGERGMQVPVAGPREVAEVGESVNALAESLARSEGRQREFLMSVSHELRTPLTAIHGFGEALADGVATGPEARRAGQVVVAESTRLERLVGDLLELARVGGADFSVDLAPVDLGELAGAAAQVWAERARAVGVVFSRELPDQPLVVVTDAVRLRQVVDGLAENALRVTPAGAPLVLAVRPEPGYAVVEVRDGGPGLTEEDRAVAFERSALHDRYRGERRVGTGLGLALVKALVTGLGGEVSVGDAPAEGGTTFAVRLPMPDRDDSA